MKANFQDVRERILRAVDHGYPRTEIVQMFGISLSTLKQYVKQRREKGHMQPKAIPGRPSKNRAQVEAGMVPSYRCITMLPWNNTVTFGNKLTVNV